VREIERGERVCEIEEEKIEREGERERERERVRDIRYKKKQSKPS
jgi:hypothetical protein